ncbi:GAK9 protein, partial [Ceuthmochares aereus]|nr:GAK9 protein [Ceuthmochares aereus]
VHNELLQMAAEKRAAGRAAEAHRKNLSYGQEGEPLAPAVSSVIIPLPSPPAAQNGSSPAVQPSAPPPDEPCASEPAAPPKDRNRAVASPTSSSSKTAPFGDIAGQRREVWAQLAREAALRGDEELMDVATDLACPVVYTPLVDQGGQQIGLQATHTSLDWKLLSQLRQTVTQFGVKSEPVKQMLDYLFNTMLLLPSDCRGIAKLIFTQHQQLLFDAHWQGLVNECVAVQRGPGDPLQGVTVEELMGLGPYLRTEAQLVLGPDKVREAMRLVRLAMDRVKVPGGIPAYMGIKQGREESFGDVLDKAAAAIERAGAPDYMREALLKQCALQNSNPQTQRVLSTLGANWTIAEALERMALQPVGSQVLLVKAIEGLGVGLQKQAEAAQAQVLAALAPLQASVGNLNAQRTPGFKCYRCGNSGHVRRACQATGVWCQTCQSPNHNTAVCRRRQPGNPQRSKTGPPGNSKRSANGRAPIQVAVTRTTALPPVFNPPPQDPSDWTWQPQ